MADNHGSTGGHPDIDYAEHEATYRLVIGLAKWGTIVCVGILVFMAVTLL